MERYLHGGNDPRSGTEARDQKPPVLAVTTYCLMCGGHSAPITLSFDHNQSVNFTDELSLRRFRELATRASALEEMGPSLGLQ